MSTLIKKYDLILKNLTVLQICKLRLILDKADHEDPDVEVILDSVRKAVSNLPLVGED